MDPSFGLSSKHEYHHLGILPEYRSDQREIKIDLVGLEKPACKMKGQLSPNMEEIMSQEVVKPTSIGTLHDRRLASSGFDQLLQHDPIHPG